MPRKTQIDPPKPTINEPTKMIEYHNGTRTLIQEDEGLRYFDSNYYYLHHINRQCRSSEVRIRVLNGYTERYRDFNPHYQLHQKAREKCENMERYATLTIDELLHLARNSLIACQTDSVKDDKAKDIDNKIGKSLEAVNTAIKHMDSYAHQRTPMEKEKE